MEFITLSNGVKMPALGYGTFTMSNEETERCVLEAIKTGYRYLLIQHKHITMKKVLVMQS